MKHALHFATKLNSGDTQKYNCFWSSYDLFASACKAVFHAPTVTGVHRLRFEICTIFVTKQAQEEHVPRVHPLPVEFTYTVRDQGIITATGWGGGWGKN